METREDAKKEKKKQIKIGRISRVWEMVVKLCCTVLYSTPYSNLSCRCPVATMCFWDPYPYRRRWVSKTLKGED